MARHCFQYQASKIDMKYVFKIKITLTSSTYLAALTL